MTDKEYTQKMQAFVRELNRHASTEPFDPVGFDNLVRSIVLVTVRWIRTRRYPLWHFWLKLFFLVLLLVGVVLMLFC